MHRNQVKNFFIIRDQALVWDHVLDQVLALMAAIADSVDVIVLRPYILHERDNNEGLLI